MAFKRGDIVLVRFPNSDLVTFKTRPALIVQSDSLRLDIHQSLVVLVTSNMKRRGRTRIPVASKSAEGQAMGIVSDSVIVVDNVATVPAQALYRVIGRCPFMQKVDEAWRLVLAL